MEMPSSDIRSALSSHQLATERMHGVTARLSSGLRSPKPSDDPVRWTDALRLKDAAQRLEEFSDNMSRAGLSARIAMHSMQASDAQLLEMRVSLTNAMEAAPGSEARRVSLEQFNVQHRLADDYSMPSDLNARKLLDRPERFNASGDIAVAAGENNFRIHLRHQPIHLGAEGLDLPQAGEPRPSAPGTSAIIEDIGNASDDEIRAMDELLTAARDRLQERQTLLSVDIMAVERQEAQSDVLQSSQKRIASDVESADLAAEAALAQSINLRSSLALSGIASFNETRSMVLQLLG
jgi:flagellin-like hook-associated protein FlgL